MKYTCEEYLYSNVERKKLLLDYEKSEKELKKLEKRRWESQGLYNKYKKVEQENRIIKTKAKGLLELKNKKFGSISEKFDVSLEGLERHSDILYIDKKEIYIDKGFSYYPRKGGYGKRFQGKIVIGPREWVGKNSWEIKEIRDEINKNYDKVLKKKIGGDFAKAKFTKYQGNLARMLQGYKSPLTCNNTENIHSISRAYLKKGKVNIKGHKDIIKNEIKERILYLKNRSESKFAQKSIEEIPQWKFEQKMKAIRSLESASRELGQNATDEFYSEIQRTQRDLVKRYKGKKNITLYRGIQGDYADEIKKGLKKYGEVTMNAHPVSSWTSDEATAEIFAAKGKGVILKKEIPIKDIMFTHHTSPYIRTSDFVFGGSEEYEYIVGNKVEKITIKASEIIE